MKYTGIREEELKNKVSRDWFNGFDCTEIIGEIDFSVFPIQEDMFGRTPLLWAEAKKGDYDPITMFVQLILTIGKARTFDKLSPPAFLGAFDYNKIIFLPYISVQDIFYLNDFNWNVTPSNHSTKEFELIKERVQKNIDVGSNVFSFEADSKELKNFIKNNIAKASTTAKIKIDKNNFIPIYLRWLEFVKPIIDVNWDDLGKASILDSDFYLADLFVDDKGTQTINDDESVRDNLFVVFKNNGYAIAKENIQQMFDATIDIKIKETYQQFWKRYKRPPIKIFQDYIIQRRDLLVPQDIRERKGAFFTPQKWVELSQSYLAKHFGENWQDDYFIWDCAAGTGNLLAGLNNKYNIFASTLDQADVNVMHERIDKGANLLKKHVFQFDFLNDSLEKLPLDLQNIINDEEKSKKLIIYINPPYAEATNAKTLTGSGENKIGVATSHAVKARLKETIGSASNELFALFMILIKERFPNSQLGIFAKMKFIQGTNFRNFKIRFKADYIDGFISPAKTFDNVKGNFPIGFTMWNLDSENIMTDLICDVYDKNAIYIGEKVFRGNLPKSINKWIKNYDASEDVIGRMVSCAPDFQHDKQLAILSKQQKRYCFGITIENIIPFTVYYAVRKVITPNWINDRDQYLWPLDSWKMDDLFKGDCLMYTLFDNQIQSKLDTNHWIPFSESEVDSKARFDSNLIYRLISGKMSDQNNSSLIPSSLDYLKAFSFSKEALNTKECGRKLWMYYHSKEGTNVNASFYEIREFFQGRNTKSRMNSSSDDKKYNELLSGLRESLKVLADNIVPKLYEHRFLIK